MSLRFPFARAPESALRRRPTFAMFALLLGISLCMTGCKSGDSAAAPIPEPSALAERPQAPTTEDRLIVFAATSLKDAFTALGEEFKRAHKGVEVVFNFAGTQELRTQLEQGAAADVFASADLKHMGELLKAGAVISPVTFARNEPVIVVAKESAATIRGIADLKRASRLVVGLPDVPIGRYTLQILDKASEKLGKDFRSRVEANVVSREPNVRQVLAKVSLGEAHAGIVYRTDANSAKDQVAVVGIPPEMNVVAEYPIAIVKGAAHASLARDWVTLATSAEGQRVLNASGFLSPATATAAP